MSPDTAIPCLVYLNRMAWTVETLGEVVDAELANLPARFVRVAELIEVGDMTKVKDLHAYAEPAATRGF